MIDTIKKEFYSPNQQGTGSFAEVTVDSIANKAILLGYHHSNERFVIYQDEIDSLIDSLNNLRGYL